MRGRFITIEGVEAVGKSTVIEHVLELIANSGIRVEKTAEPGGTNLCREIRRLLLTNWDEEPISDMTELLLYFAARAQHIDQFIKPKLQAGTWIVSDRFTDSTIAYQGGGRGISQNLIMDLANRIHADFWPDLTLILDANLDILSNRMAGRELDRMEQQDREFFVHVQETYRELATRESRCVLIDAGQEIDNVIADVSKVVSNFVGSNA